MDISRQLACMKLGSREKYQPIQYCWVHISRLLVSYMPFAYRYPKHTDRTAFMLAALMLSCLRAVTIICNALSIIMHSFVMLGKVAFTGWLYIWPGWEM